MAAASAGAIVQQAREDTNTALEEFRRKADALSGQVRMHFEAQAAQLQKMSEGESEKLSAEFRSAQKLHLQDEFAAARKELQAQLETAREELSREGEAYLRTLAESAMALHETTIEEYRRKLDSASNSWLLTTVAKLSQHTDQHVQMLTRAAEDRLRAACTEVFSGVGDALRRGLVDVELPQAPPKSDE